MRIVVLDKGYVELINQMNKDKDIVRIQRISYNGEAYETKEEIERLISLLIRKEHFSVFEHSVFTFKVKCPIFVQRQWFRHRIGSFTEQSGRYTVLDEGVYIPDENRLEKDVKDLLNEQVETSFKVYGELIDLGVQKELQRIILPLNVYTKFFWTVNVRSLMNFFKLRLNEHAQWEIREYQKQIWQLFEDTLPITQKYFKEYVLKT